MADGPFYVDTREPYTVTLPASVTLTTVLAILCPGSFIPQLPANYFNFVGKAVRVRCAGQATSGTTPGALDFQFNYGSAISNTGSNLCGVNVTWTASVSQAQFIAEAIVRCRSLGTSGTLSSWGYLLLQNTGTVLMPPTGGGTIATVDLTTANYIIPQCSRSGSTAETIQMFDYSFEALN